MSNSNLLYNNNLYILDWYENLKIQLLNENSSAYSTIFIDKVLLYLHKTIIFGIQVLILIRPPL